MKIGGFHRGIKIWIRSSAECCGFEFGESLRPAERQELSDAFQFLADHPFSVGDYQESAPDGRTLEILLRGRFLFTFWTDHAVKEVRLLGVDQA